MTRTPPRRLRVAALATVLALVLAVAAAVGWFVVVPGAGPSLQAGEAYGIDVSNHQGPTDWPSDAADGVGFAYLKATEGRSFVDPYFAGNWADSKRVGIDRCSSMPGAAGRRSSRCRAARADSSGVRPSSFDGVTGRVDLDVVRPAPLTS